MATFTVYPANAEHKQKKKVSGDDRHKKGQKKPLYAVDRKERDRKTKTPTR
jgi:hypothetical protein